MKYSGSPVSSGIACGEVYIYQPFKPQIEEVTIQKHQVEDYCKQYLGIKEQAKQELEAIQAGLGAEDPEKAKIFRAHIDILFDEAMDEDIVECISCDLISPETAIHTVYEKYIRMLSRAKDPLIRERAADLQDVRSRLLRVWFGVPEKNLAKLDRPVIVVAHDLFPSDTATLDRKNVLAIVTEIGGATSHSAIIAKSYEIPALLGVPDIMSVLKEGETIIVDAIKGELFTQPDAEQLAAYGKKREAHLAHAAEVKKFKYVAPVTKDGTKIEVELNIGSSSPTELAGADCTDGVGLFRSEFLYMGRPQLPSEEEQVAVYSTALNTFGDRPVILRTLDIGGDKKLESMQLPQEDNPFLGLRALRLCFENLPVFKTQLRAALRAGVQGNLWVMFPMVGSIDDIRGAKEVVQQVKEELAAEGLPFNPDVKLGIMVEIPSIAMVADMAAKEADFASVGTNDLCQYLTAVDRLNPSVSKYYQSYHPAMFRLIGQVISAFGAEGKPVGVCGEMGGDPLAAAVLIGLGMRQLSMGIASVPGIKKLITGITIRQAEAIAQKVCSLSTAAEVTAYLKEELKEIL